MFDGALARATGRTSTFGALLDSVVDRTTESIVLLGLLVFFVRESSLEGAVLVYLALAGSVMVSYVRARAEGLGVPCSVGIMARPERVVTLGAGVIIGHWWLTGTLVALGAIAGLSTITFVWRLRHVSRAVRERE